MTRMIIVGCLALGLAAVSVALGFIYMDFTRREGAWVELSTLQSTLSEDERQELLDAWREPGNTVGALLAGTMGVALLGVAVGLTVFELPWLRNPRGTSP